MPRNKRLCSGCGKVLDEQTNFCRHCGCPASLSVSKRRRQWPRRLVIVVIVGIILITLLAFLGGKAANRSGDSGKAGMQIKGTISLGNSVVDISQELPAEGGMINVISTASTLNGLQISVPKDAYGQPTRFKISETEIRQHDFGSLFNPVTPLITIENGHGFAAAAMTVQIPITLAQGEFAMAFYYDRQSRMLEGIPCLAQDSRSITILTSHFSELMVTKAQYADLDALVRKGPVDSGFKPGLDDLFAANYGSYAFPSGHCAGQSIAAMHYYNDHLATEKHLRQNPIVDNGTGAATPSLNWDDALTYRLCSELQGQYARRWGKAYDDRRNGDEELSYYSFLYAIHLTGRPQYVDIRTTDLRGGHAMIIYKVTRDALWVCDPNYPGEDDRKIKVSRTLDAALAREKVLLDSYLAKPNAKGVAREYPWISYYGVNALVDQTAVEASWLKVLSGKDAASGIFPADPQMVLATGRNKDGSLVTATLSPGGNLSVSEKDLLAVDPAAKRTIYLAPATKTSGQTLSFYRKDQSIGTASGLSAAEGNWYGFTLQPGANDIGIWYTLQDSNGDDQYVNFYRYTLNLGTSDVTETTRPAADAFFGNWVVTDFQMTGFEGMSSTFRNQIIHDGGNPDKWVLYQLSDFHDIFMSIKNLDGTNSAAAEIRIGSPPAGAGDQWTGKFFFQTNSSTYIGRYNVIVDGKKQNYRQTTLTSTLLADGNLQVTGFEGCGGLDENDMAVDMILTADGKKTLQGTGTTVINAFSGGRIKVSFTCTLSLRSRTPAIRPEYGN